ncbi:MAG: hypothetical protein DWQ10_16360 [Calditrichaeota bacterium]|nr:MAG: hypothetical protein DWQ10_16360 [Calditrichota bacterium]
MSLGQLVIIILACVSVAKAFIYFGELEYKGKWLNYLIAILGGVLGARLGLIIPAFQTIALLVSIGTAIALLTIYQLIRWRFIHWHSMQNSKSARRAPAWQIR